jgi:hypothetical protein
MNLSRRNRSQSGQTLLWIAGTLVTIVAIAGLAIDAGAAFASRAKLAKAVDAAALVGARNVSKPDGLLKQIVNNAVVANFKGAVVNVTNDITLDRITRAPAVLVTVKATYQHNTSFIRVLGVAAFNVLNISATAQAIRYPIVMGLIVDRSGSMHDNGGETTVETKMPSFLDNFAEGLDTVGLFAFNANGVREMRFTTNFLTAGKAKLGGGIPYGGWTGPSEAMRMCVQDIQTVPGYTNSGVKKIIVFLTDGQFNTFRMRPPDVLGAFSEPPPGKTNPQWSNLWYNSGRPVASGGSDPAGLSYGASNLTLVFTNGSLVDRYTNLDMAVSQDMDLYFPVISQTNWYSFTNSVGGPIFTNTYQMGNSDYTSPDINKMKASLVKLVNTKWIMSNSNDTVSGRMKWVSTVDGLLRTYNNANCTAEANDHMLRYCTAIRRTTTDPRRVTVFTIGFTAGVEPNILKKMANVSGSGAPYTPLDSTEPYDDTFGYTYAEDAAALSRTITALGNYLATRLTQ